MVLIITTEGISFSGGFFLKYCHPAILAIPPYSLARAYKTCKQPISHAMPKMISEIMDSAVDHPGQLAPTNGKGYNKYQPGPNLAYRVAMINPITPNTTEK